MGRNNANAIHEGGELETAGFAQVTTRGGVVLVIIRRSDFRGESLRLMITKIIMEPTIAGGVALVSPCLLH